MSVYIFMPYEAKHLKKRDVPWTDETFRCGNEKAGRFVMSLIDGTAGQSVMTLPCLNNGVITMMKLM